MKKKDNKKDKAVIILSGGMDSTTLLYDILRRGYDVYALSFNYGQKHSVELAMAALTCIKLKVPHKVLNLEVLSDIAPSALTRHDWKMPEGEYNSDSMKLTVVPNRNMVMLSLAASYAIGIGAKHLFYGAHAGDHAIYPDCRPKFVEAMKDVLRLCDWSKLSLHVPYLNNDKAEIVSKGVRFGVDYSLTWTCYQGGEFACGKCGSCDERLMAFKANGLVDPIKYKEDKRK